MAQLIQNGDLLSGSSRDASSVYYTEFDGTHRSVQSKLNDLSQEPNIELTGVLLAGETTIVLSNPAITNDAILDLDVFTSVFGLIVNSIEVNTISHTVTLTFNAQDSNINVKVMLWKNTDIGVELVQTLKAGDTTITFVDASITQDSTFACYTTVFGLPIQDVVCDTGTLTLTFDSQNFDVQVKVRVW